MRVPDKLGRRRNPKGPEGREGRKDADGAGQECTTRTAPVPWSTGHTDTWGTVILCGGRSGEQSVWYREVSSIPGLYPRDAASCDDKNVSRHCQIPPEGQLTLGEEPLPRKMATTRMIWGWAQHNVGYLPYMFTLQSTIRFTPLICPPQRILQSFHILRYDSSFAHC